jgi:TonB family protein
MFAALESESTQSSWIRLLAGGAANLLIIGLLVWGPLPQGEAPQTRPQRWVSIKMPNFPAPLSPTLPVPRLPRPNAVLPKPAMAAATTLELPAPPVVATREVPAPPVPLPSPAALPAPKPILGSFESSAPAAPTQPSRREARVEASGFGQQIESKWSSRRELVESVNFNQTKATEAPRKQMAVATSSGFESNSLAPAKAPNQLVREGEFRGVEILTKPRPMYTEMARKLGIEGEVHLKILFGADGKLKVLTVVKGLGHGLDENAALAAAQIQFRPAQQKGQPIEQAAVVRVLFQLAN